MEKGPRGDDKDLSSTFHPYRYLSSTVQEKVWMGGRGQRRELLERDSSVREGTLTGLSTWNGGGRVR